MIIDDFEEHPLLERLTAASRTMTALCNAKVPISLDSSKGYVHRTSAMRGESRGAQWTGKEHTFKAEEAWAIRGCLHPAWRRSRRRSRTEPDASRSTVVGGVAHSSTMTVTMCGLEAA